MSKGIELDKDEIEAKEKEEKALLKSRLEQAGIKVHHLWQLPRLREEVKKLAGVLEKAEDEESQGLSVADAEHLEDQLAKLDKSPEVKALKLSGKFSGGGIKRPLSKVQQEAIKRREAQKLVRITLTPLDPSLKGHTGWLCCVENRFISERKFIPFGKPWYVPQIMVPVLENAVYVSRQAKKVTDGFNQVNQTVPRFGVLKMEDISVEELKDIKNKQLARNDNDE